MFHCVNAARKRISKWKWKDLVADLEKIETFICDIIECVTGYLKRKLEELKHSIRDVIRPWVPELLRRKCILWHTDLYSLWYILQLIVSFEQYITWSLYCSLGGSIGPTHSTILRVGCQFCCLLGWYLGGWLDGEKGRADKALC